MKMSAPTISFVVVEIPVKCFILQQQYCLYENGFQNDNVDRCLNITTVVTKMNKHYINRDGNARQRLRVFFAYDVRF